MDEGKTTADLLYDLETTLHKKEVRHSPQLLAALLADEFIEFGSSGRVFSKAAIIEALKEEAFHQRAQVENFQARELAPGIALVTYTAARTAPNGLISTRTLRSSLWKREGGAWRMIFHQGTRIPE
jgi:glyoxylase I family protein